MKTLHDGAGKLRVRTRCQDTSIGYYPFDEEDRNIDMALCCHQLDNEETIREE